MEMERLGPAVADGAAEVASSALRRFHDRSAVALLMDLAATDQRPPHQNPEHPLRTLTEVARQLHPDLGAIASARGVVLEPAGIWIDARDSDEAWGVYGDVAAAALDPEFEGHWMDPAEPFRFVWAKQICSPRDLEEIATQHWPGIRDRLERGPAVVTAKMIDTVGGWLHLGLGRAGSMAEPDAAQQESARRFGTAMFADLAEHSRRSVPLSAKAYEAGMRFEVDVDVDVDAEFAALFGERFGTEPWEELERKDQERLAALAATWAGQDPGEVVDRLRRWSIDAKAAGVALTHRIGKALAHLAPAVDDPGPWATALVDAGLGRDGAPLLAAVLARDGLGCEWFERLLADPECRGVALQIGLSTEMPAEVAERTARELGAGDFWAIEFVFAHRPGPDPTLARLLQHPDPVVRATVALQCSPDGTGHGPVVGPELWPLWREAFLGARHRSLGHHSRYELEETLQRLVSSDPPLAEEWLRRNLEETGLEGLSEMLGGRLGMMAGLPLAGRDQLVRAFGGDSLRYLLADLLGNDAEWLGQLIDDKVIDVDTALHALFGRRGPIFEAGAKILMRRGADPRAVAGAAQRRSGSGKISAEHASLIAYFGELRSGGDPELAALGEAGVQVFEQSRLSALEWERRERIRGL